MSSRPPRRSRKKIKQQVRGQSAGQLVSVSSRTSGNSVGKSTTLISVEEILYQQWKRKLIQDPEIMGGETVFPNSRITVRRIAALVERGEDPSVILEDYPGLKPLDFEFAPIYIKRQTGDRSFQPV